MVQFGVFLFFAAFVAIMTVYVWILLPETKAIPVEEIMDAWAKWAPSLLTHYQFL